MGEHGSDEVRRRSTVCSSLLDQRRLRAAQINAEPIARRGCREPETPDTPCVSDIGATFGAHGGWWRAGFSAESSGSRLAK
jgi:hypothetical protein